MRAWTMLAVGTAVALTMMFAVWLLHIHMRNASIVDVAWSADPRMHDIGRSASDGAETPS